MYESLSKTQKEAVDYFDGNLSIVAGAGSGKTRVIIEKILKTLERMNSGERILAITFSNKAADELRERLEETLDKEIIESKIFVGTIHNFCLDFVNSRGSSIGLPNNITIFESYDDRLKIFSQAINNVPTFKNKLVNPAENDRKIREFFDALSNAKRNLKFYENYEKDSPTSLLFKEYDELLVSQGAIDFDDILRYAYKILNEAEHIKKLYQKIYKYIFVDEAQDLNKAQYEIVKLLSGDSNITTMVGDPNQSIYGFNGSSEKYFLTDFENDLGANKIELRENFRSAKKVVNAAKRLESSFDVEGICYYDGEFEINAFETEIDEANWIYNKISGLIQSGHSDVENQTITLNQCAVIARNRYLFNKLKEILDENEVEYKLKVSLNNAFSSESTIMKAFEYGIKLIVNSKDKIHLDYLNQLLGLNNSFEKILNTDFLSNQSDLLKKAMPTIQIAWKELISTKENNINIKQVLSKIDEEINKQEIEEAEKNLIINDIDTLIQLWNIYVAKSNVTNRSLINFIRSISLGETQINSDKGLILTTVHMSKGLEYDVVFIMGLNDGVFPDYRSLDDEQKLLEEKHNMFVSITRSKRLCYITYPLNKETRYGNRSQSVSRFIKEIQSKIE